MNVLEIIGRLQWRVAKTMPEIPHEYTVRSAATEADYVALFTAIQTDGTFERYNKRKKRCEAAIRYHEAEAARHYDEVAEFNRLHARLCHGPSRWRYLRDQEPGGANHDPRRGTLLFPQDDQLC